MVRRNGRAVVSCTHDTKVPLSIGAVSGCSGPGPLRKGTVHLGKGVIFMCRKIARSRKGIVHL